MDTAKEIERLFNGADYSYFQDALAVIKDLQKRLEVARFALNEAADTIMNKIMADEGGADYVEMMYKLDSSIEATDLSKPLSD